jgi:protein SCO1
MTESKYFLPTGMNPMYQTRILLGITMLTLMVAAIIFVSQSASPVSKFASTDITGSGIASAFELTDHNGKRRQLSEFKGKIVVLFFGYTQCPDVCPTSMSAMMRIKSAMGKDGDLLQLLFVTVDPERDSQEVLKAYMENFDPTFLALRPAPQELSQVAEAFRVFYQRVGGTTSTSYSMDHTASSYVYDLQGRLRLLAPYGLNEGALLEDIRQLIKG